MGYVSKNIADIVEPDVVTLAALPNFVQFSSKPGVKVHYENNITVNARPLWQIGYYNVSGQLVPTTLGGWRASIPVDVSAYVGATALFHGYAPIASAAYGHFLNASGAIISSFQTTAQYWTGAIPVGAKWVILSNTVQAVVTPTFVISGTDLLDIDLEAQTVLNFTEPSGVLHTFHGTTDESEVGGAVYFISQDVSDTAENLREALIANAWINANFEVRIPFTWLGSTSVNGKTLVIRSKGTGKEYNVVVVAPNNAGNVAYTITPVSTTSVNNDSISGEASTAEIELDVYVDPDVFLGQDDRPTTAAKLGNFAVSLQKTYAGAPTWFELNALFQQYAGHTVPPAATGWFNTGSVRAYRFVAKRKAVNSFAFYQSSALFVLNGYGYASDPINLSEYTYGDGPFLLLTNKPRTPYIRGQREYLNFIFKDPEPRTMGEDYQLRVQYEAYSTSNAYLGTIYAHPVNRLSLSIVNTCVLDIDAVLTAYPKAGIVRVALASGTGAITNKLEYLVRPECLHKLTQFTFLNRLGGWDAFNFDAPPQDDVKPEVDTYSKTIKPGFTRNDSIETVYNTRLDLTTTVEGAPVTDEVAEWLRELAAARVILDGEGNYIVVEDFTLKTGDATQNMQVPTIKYHLSETFTNG